MTHDPMTLIPWVEANQGLISVLALIAALTVAVLEYRRANAIEEGRDNRFRSTILALLDNLAAKANEGLATLRRPDIDALDGNSGFEVWRREATRTHEAIKALRPAAPPDPDVILMLVEIENELDPARGASHIIQTGQAIAGLDLRLQANNGLRSRFARLKARPAKKSDPVMV